MSVFLYWEVKESLILHLEPEPLPAVIDQIQDEELDLSMEHESLGRLKKTSQWQKLKQYILVKQTVKTSDLNIAVFYRKKC